MVDQMRDRSQKSRVAADGQAISDPSSKKFVFVSSHRQERYRCMWHPLWPKFEAHFRHNVLPLLPIDTEDQHSPYRSGCSNMQRRKIPPH